MVAKPTPRFALVSATEQEWFPYWHSSFDECDALELADDINEAFSEEQVFNEDPREVMDLSGQYPSYPESWSWFENMQLDEFPNHFLWLR